LSKLSNNFGGAFQAKTLQPSAYWTNLGRQEVTRQISTLCQRDK